MGRHVTSSHDISGMGRILWLAVIALAGALTGYVATRIEGTAPHLEILPGAVHIGAEETIEVRASDAGAGLENVRVWLERGETRIPLADESYPGNLLTGSELDRERRIEIVIRPRDLGVADGTIVVRAEARDFSWRGNRAQAHTTIHLDTKPPSMVVETGLTYVRRGGAELAVYRISEPAQEHGVQIGDQFFPGYPYPGDPTRFVAFYALSPSAPTEASAEVVAVDRAGNRSVAPLSISIVERSFPEDTVTLTEAFMQRKVTELLPEHVGGVLDGYLHLNRDLRTQHSEQIVELCTRSSADRLWTGPFLQLPSSKVSARFAELRTYLFQGNPVDEQRHLGFDLASTARAPVPASNDGVVVLAESLGIYGNTVILDHGLGIFTLYGHLSEITVEKGQAVARSEPLGRTGATGLAGGDHLHFSVLVSGRFVDPLEWFDGRWIREHVEAKLAAEPEPDQS